jgi:glutathione-independent formaldehyde dehydrogenase
MSRCEQQPSSNHRPGACDRNQRCNCREGWTSLCLNVNPERAGGAYGYVDMGG